MMDESNGSPNIDNSISGHTHSSFSDSNSSDSFAQGLVSKMLDFFISPSKSSISPSVSVSVDKEDGSVAIDEITRLKTEIQELKDKLKQNENEVEPSTETNQPESNQLESNQPTPDVPPVPSSLNFDLKSQFLTLFDNNPRNAAKFFQDNQAELAKIRFFN